MISDSVCFGITTGVIASVVFSLLTFFIKYFIFKPRIKLSDKIQKKEENGQTILRVKVVNKSFFKATNLYYCLRFCDKDDVDDVNTVEEIQPRKTRSTLLHGYSFSNTDYASRFSYILPKKFKIDSENKKLEFFLIAHHSLSNRMKCFGKEYTSKDIVSDGFFETGRSVKITKH